MEVLRNVKNFIDNLTQKIYFNDIYVAVLALISLISWKFSTNFGMVSLSIISILILLIKKDLKYIIPEALFFIFTINEGFLNNKIPIDIIIFGSLFIIIILIFSFKNMKKSFNKLSIISFIGLAICTIIPIFWSKVPSVMPVLYFLYFCCFLYFILYFIMYNGIKENSLEILSISMSYLGLLIAFQVITYVTFNHNNYDSIFQMYYHLGWGLCNEAGIMICMSLPFTFYLLGKEKSIKGMIYQNLKIIILVIGMLFTTSRGTYIFGCLELIFLYVSLFFVSKNKKLFKKFHLFYFLILLILALCSIKPIIDIVEKINLYVFTNKLNSSGRFKLWEDGFGIFKSNFKNVMLGSGIVSEIGNVYNLVGLQQGVIIYHSTIIEALVMFGIIGFIFLIIHFINKYKGLFKFDKLFLVTTIIGFFFVDLYGLIDNTYFMYYYMIPLSFIMAVIDNTNMLKNVNISLIK